MKINNPSVAIVIVNYNNFVDTIECLESLKNIDYPNYTIFLVDNKSTNDSVSRLTEYMLNFSRKIFFITSERNLGFAGGNNIAIRKALELNFDYILLLNNDTIVEKNFLSEMISVIENREDIGVVGCKIKYFRNKQLIWYAGGHIDWFRFSGIHHGINELDRGQYDQIEEVSFITGCCMLIKSDVINKVGLLCEDYFLYNEDLDYSIRIIDQGYKLVYNPKSIIYHKVGQASGGEKSPFAIKCFVKSKKLFFKKYRNRVSSFRFLFSYLLWYQYTLCKGIISIFRGKFNECKAYLGVLHSD